MSLPFKQFLELLGLFAVLLPAIIFLTGKKSLRKISWIAAMSPNKQRWIIGIISILIVIVCIVAVIFTSKDKTQGNEYHSVNADFSQHPTTIINHSDRKVTIVKESPSIPKEPLRNVLNTDVKVIMRIDNERNDVFSDSLAAFYKKRGYKVAIGNAPGLVAGNSVIGDLSASVIEEGVMGTRHYTNYKVKLALKVYKGDDANPCTDRIYEQKMTLIANGSKETLIEQGFGELLSKIKAEPTTPVCL
ncbi:hypothetical protein SAMN05518672_104781 [Chitinophaga sp. CF118]|uniref:hypothetical protein n=1 Tax=Chitinophaga sp. CF118 TaxID=1884367 RepID=UPI0008DFC07E|nr:hypothetical protein [Chitinophaga sp. CF118]SFE17966.1 hypothetical protein SAMN05518672_104781 [Chitinophaga sp. CF118]